MLKHEITHKGTLKAIEKYEITDDMIEQLENIEVLRLFIKNLSRRKWQREHKDYYAKRYKLVKKGEYQVGSVQYDKTPIDINLEPREKVERSAEYMRQYNREYYHKKRKTKKIVELPKLCCDKCKCELTEPLEIIPEE
jgi:hypothetical protein